MRAPGTGRATAERGRSRQIRVAALDAGDRARTVVDGYFHVVHLGSAIENRTAESLTQVTSNPQFSPRSPVVTRPAAAPRALARVARGAGGYIAKKKMPTHQIQNSTTRSVANHDPRARRAPRLSVAPPQRDRNTRRMSCRSVCGDQAQAHKISLLLVSLTLAAASGVPNPQRYYSCYVD